MTEPQYKMHQEDQRVKERTVEAILCDHTTKGNKLGRMQARKYYAALHHDQCTPKRKKLLWRMIGKFLSINDMEFDICDDNRVVVKSVSSLNLKGNEAQGLSVDCLRSFCAELGMRRTGRLKKDA